MADFFWFSDEQWARIEQLLPRDMHGLPRVDDRRTLSGIVHALKSGGRWGDCPEPVYGPKKTGYNGFRRWAGRAAGSLFRGPYSASAFERSKAANFSVASPVFLWRSAR